MTDTVQRRPGHVTEAETAPDEIRDFMLIVRRALLLIVAYIDRRYMPSKS